MTAFLTGSHAYGDPNEGSDIDVVILVDGELLRVLREFTESTEILQDGNKQLRFGRLNIIAAESDTEFATWRVGTSACKLRKTADKSPVERCKAKELIDAVREMVGLKDNGDSRTAD